MPAGQCETCVRWGSRGGVILPAVEGCTWMTDRQIEVLPAPAVELLIALAPLAAREGRCPGHMQVDLETMPDAYLAVDMPRENAQPEVLRLLKALAEMRS